MFKKLTDKSGFSLFELIVTLSIFGVMMAIAIPSFLSYRPLMRVNSAARELSSNMQWARMKAVSENNNFVIQFDSDNNSFSIYDDDDSDWTTTGDNTLLWTVTLPDGIKFGRALAGVNRTSCGGTIATDGIHLPGGGTRLTFQAKGTISGTGASIYLIPTIDDENNAQRTDRWRAISMSLGGRIKIWKYDTTAVDCGNSQGPWS